MEEAKKEIDGAKEEAQQKQAEAEELKQKVKKGIVFFK